MVRGIGFFWEFMKDPGTIGAVAPSSKKLARRMVEWIDWNTTKVIVEYGPGTGVFTREIIQRMNPDATYIGLEVNPKMVDCLRQSYPGLAIYKDSVVNVRNYLNKHGVNEADVIISGLPWASFNFSLQDSLMQATINALKKGGRFATFAYLQGLILPTGRKFKRKLSENFNSIEFSPVTWLNIPPAFVYRCVK